MIKQITHLAGSYLKDPRHWLSNVRWRIPTTISDLPAVFIVGAPRSGTTLLQRILASHSNFCSIEGETGMFTYQNIFDRRHRRHFDLSPDEADVLLRTSRDNVDFFTNASMTVCRKHNKSRFVEKTPQHVLRLKFLSWHFPKASLIHIVRDGRDCYCSAKDHRNIPQKSSVARFAKYWVKCVSRPSRLKSSVSLLTVKYENLSTAAERELTRIMAFLGEAPEPQQLDPSELSKDRRATRTEFARLSKAINDSSVGRWKQEMPSSAIRRFEAIAGTQLSEFGYHRLPLENANDQRH